MDVNNERFKEIINHLADAAIYVIRRDTHELLFFNERVKKVTPGVRLGLRCDDVWRGNCANCPLLTIGDKDHHVTTNYDDPFGAAVDISASKIMWDQEIPAYLICITRHMATYAEKYLLRSNRLLLSATDNANAILLEVDVLNDACQVVSGEFRYLKELSGVSRYSQLVSGLVKSFTTDSVSAFLNRFSGDAVREAFSRGETSIQSEFQITDEFGTEHWCQARILSGEQTESKLDSVMFLTVLDEEKRFELDSQTFSAGLAALFGECMVVNLDRDEYRTVKGDYYTNKMSKTGIFSEANEYYCRHAVHEQDRRAFLNAYSLPALREAYDAGKKAVVLEARRKEEDEKYHYVELTAVRAETALSHNRMMLLVYRNIDDLKRQQKEHEEYMRRFALVMRNAYAEVIEIDFCRRCALRWARQDTLITPTELPIDTEKAFNDFFNKNRVTTECADAVEKLSDPKYLRGCFVAGESEIRVEVASRESGKWYMVEVQPLEISKKEFRLIYLMIDIDDQHRAQEEERRVLQDALQLAEQANAAKTDFLSRMSHDIRTPLNAIIGMSRIAKDHAEDPARVRDSMSKIDVSAKFLLSLINNILDMSKIESGKMTLSEEAFSLLGVCRDLSGIISPQAASRKQKFEVQIQSGICDMYIGDVLRLKQILLNLLSNSIKYTPDGGEISLSVSVLRPERAGNSVAFVVRDNGRGMSKEFMDVLFQPFKRELSESDNQGSRLGLAITRNLVHMMHGTISVRSEKNKGTLISVVLPLPCAEAAGKGAEIELNEEATEVFHGKRVLVVEDNDINMEIVCQLVEQRGCVTESAVNGRDAVEKFVSSPVGYYDMILMDIRMPVLDGMEAARQIRQSDRADAMKVPILALTANAFTEDAAEARLAGMNAHIAKPIEPNVLFIEMLKQLSK